MSNAITRAKARYGTTVNADTLARVLRDAGAMTPAVLIDAFDATRVTVGPLTRYDLDKLATHLERRDT